MSSDEYPKLDRPDFLNCTRFFDVFIYTQGGSIRRVSIPHNLISFTAWIFDPRMECADAAFDKKICKIADEKRIGYAEAFVEFMHQCMEAPGIGSGYAAAVEDDVTWSPVEKAFVLGQVEKQRLWREAHDDWRDPLPPALD